MDWVVAAVAWACLALSVMAIAALASNRYLLRATYGPARYDEQRVVTSLLGLKALRILQLRSHKWLLLGVGAACLAHRLQHAERPWENLGDLWLPMIALMAGCVQFAGQSRPAAILVLGASTLDALKLQRLLANKLWPHRPVSLLEGPHLLGSIFLAGGDVYRITWGDWKDAVFRFARTATVVVVDMRQMTPPVDQELRFLVADDLTFKTVLLLPPGVELPHPELAACRIVRSPDECGALLARAFSGYDTLPSDVKPIRELEVPPLGKMVS